MWGHSFRVGCAPSLNRAGFDSLTIALLGRWGSSAIFGYNREAPVWSTTSLVRQAIPRWIGAVEANGLGQPLGGDKGFLTTVATHTSGLAGVDPVRFAELEARVALLEADTAA